MAKKPKCRQRRSKQVHAAVQIDAWTSNPTYLAMGVLHPGWGFIFEGQRDPRLEEDCHGRSS